MSECLQSPHLEKWWSTKDRWFRKPTTKMHLLNLRFWATTYCWSKKRKSQKPLQTSPQFLAFQVPYVRFKVYTKKTILRQFYTLVKLLDEGIYLLNFIGFRICESFWVIKVFMNFRKVVSLDVIKISGPRIDDQSFIYWWRLIAVCKGVDQHGDNNGNSKKKIGMHRFHETWFLLFSIRTSL